MKKELKKFYKIAEYNVRNGQQSLMESFIKKSDMNRYSHRLSEMESIVNDQTILNESNDNSNVIELIRNNEFEVNNTPEFIKSLKSGNRGEFLSDYTGDEYGKMTTYKLVGYNIGFAIKSDGDIVSVHNNSNISGIGSELIKKAIEFGGTKLDHFDGYLSGFYSKLGFKLVGSDQWNDDYAPLDWKYEPVDIYNPQTSAFASELKNYPTEGDLPIEMKERIERYSAGKPDIIYREL